METIFGSSLVGQLSSTTAANFHVGFIHTLTDEAAENIINKNVVLWMMNPMNRQSQRWIFSSQDSLMVAMR